MKPTLLLSLVAIALISCAEGGHAVTIAADTMKITSKAADNTDLATKQIFDMDDEEVGQFDSFESPPHTRPQQPTGESIWNSMWDETDDDERARIKEEARSKYEQDEMDDEDERARIKEEARIKYEQDEMDDEDDDEDFRRLARCTSNPSRDRYCARYKMFSKTCLCYLPRWACGSFCPAGMEAACARGTICKHSPGGGQRHCIPPNRSGPAPCKGFKRL